MRVFIIHGFESNPNRNWFAWLKQNLEQQNIETFIPALPQSYNPTPKLWIDFLTKECENIDEKTYFVAHSLGCLALLQFLQSLENLEKIGGFVLVSGFEQKLPNLSEIDCFMNLKLDTQKLIKLTNNRLLIAARNDEIVPCEFTHALAKNLQASFIETQEGGHFMQEDGFREFPLVLNALRDFFTKN